MAKQGLRSVVVKKYNHHASHGTVPDDKENILERDLETETINQKKKKSIFVLIKIPKRPAGQSLDI